VAERLRPTLRCLREDLALPVPRVDTPLHATPLRSTTYCGYFLPGHEDDLRWRAEAAARTERRLRTTVHDLVRQSLLDGHEQAVMLDGAALGVQVLADQGHETYVAIRIIGSVPRRLVATLFGRRARCEP
jgi:hypothetical protein